MACSLSVRRNEAGGDAADPQGLLVNHAYAVLDVQTLPDLGGLRMVKVRFGFEG